MDPRELFSRREGHEDTEYLQTEELNNRTRNRLSNAFLETCYAYQDEYSEKLFKSIFDVVLGESSYSVRARRDYAKMLQKVFEQFEWHKVLDIVEVSCQYDYPIAGARSYERSNRFGRVLEEEKTAYRIIDGLVVPISNSIEEESIRESLAFGGTFDITRNHIRQALVLYSDRKEPDYRNSMKESISAVEALCQKVTGNPKATLGQALNAIDDHIEIDGGMKRAFKAIYGYTSNSDGIRHALKDKSTVTSSDAKYMLVTCSAFVNYAIEKIGENNVPLT